MMRQGWLAVLLLVAACREAPPSEAESEKNAANEAAANPAPGASSRQADSANAIPEAFHGTWDRDAAACAARSEMRLEVSADSLRFHESIGRVTYVNLESDRDVFVSAAFEGEGERWTRDLMLSLEAGGELTVTQLEEPPVTRMRCA